MQSLTDRLHAKVDRHMSSGSGNAADLRPRDERPPMERRGNRGRTSGGGTDGIVPKHGGKGGNRGSQQDSGKRRRK